MTWKELSRPEDLIGLLRNRGLRDDEIEAEFERIESMSVDRDPDGGLRWDRGTFGGPYQHRLLRERLAETRSEAPPAPPRKRGRPGWDGSLLTERLAAAIEATPKPQTPSRIAEHFVALDGTMGIDAKYLGRLRKKFGL